MESKFVSQEAYNLAMSKKALASTKELTETMQQLTDTIAAERADFYSVMTELLNEHKEIKIKLSQLDSKYVPVSMLPVVFEDQQVLRKELNNLRGVVRVQLIYLILGTAAWIVTLLM